jgi:hypothetical protein
MESMRESWTDERLDDLKAEVSNVKSEVVALRVETKAGFERIDDRFEAMYRLMLQLGAVLVAALVGCIATIGGVAISQL